MIDDDGAYKMRMIGQTSPTTYESIYALRRARPIVPETLILAKVSPYWRFKAECNDLLVKCAKAILHDITVEELLSDMYPVQPALPPFSREIGAETVTIPALSEEGPYHVLHALDLDALLTLTEAKRSECEDNMWALRESPGYFVGMAISRAEHRRESVLDVHGKEHALKGTPLF